MIIWPSFLNAHHSTFYLKGRKPVIKAIPTVGLYKLRVNITPLSVQIIPFNQHVVFIFTEKSVRSASDN